MSQQAPVSREQPLLALASVPQHRDVEIANAPTIRLQTLDLARHTAIAPNGRRYVVATFDDTHLAHGYITAVYPQQNEYLTLVRLTICEFSRKTPDQAIQRHIAVVQKIQQDKLNELIEETRKNKTLSTKNEKV